MLLLLILIAVGAGILWFIISAVTQYRGDEKLSIRWLEFMLWYALAVGVGQIGHFLPWYVFGLSLHDYSIESFLIRLFCRVAAMAVVLYLVLHYSFKVTLTKEKVLVLVIFFTVFIPASFLLRWMFFNSPFK